MKRYVLLVGGAGARMMDALIAASAAGVYPAGQIDVLLADVDQRGVQGAAMLRAHLADYACVQQAADCAADGAGLPFGTALTLYAWPRELPGQAATLSDMTADSEMDALLCQAFFDQEAADIDLHEGFHGRRTLAQVTFAGLLDQAAWDETDPLRVLVADMARVAEAGEEVRVVLAGSVCSGTGSAGIPALAQFVRERVPAGVHIGAVLMAAVTDQQDAKKAREAIERYAREGLCEAVCILGLPQAARPAAPAELARLTDWLGAYCIDVLLHRPRWLDGVFTVRAPEGPLSWSIFGKAEARYRLAYGRLFKAATAIVYHIGPEAERRLKRPSFLRDLFGWYGHHYRRMETTSEEELETIASLMRLMKLLLLWLGGICKTLPTDLRYASALTEIRREAAAHYDGLTDLVSRLAILDEDQQRNGGYDTGIVHRHHTEDETEDEQAMQRIDAAKAEIARREAEQTALQRRMGGNAAMTMLEDALDRAEQEQQGLRERYAEAVRRIDHAETIATEEEQYRITDARTKLKRMERHQLLLDSRVERVRSDLEDAVAQEIRFDRPAIPPMPVENGIFHQKLVERLLQRDPVTKKELDEMWGGFVLPGETLGLPQALKALRRAANDRSAPTMALMEALLDVAMKEVQR